MHFGVNENVSIGDLDSIPVDTVATPNPEALMFRLNELLIPKGTYEFSSDDDKKHAPLAQQLFEVEDVELVLIAPRFVTINKLEAALWRDLVPQIKLILRKFLVSGELAVIENEATPAAPTSDVEARIIEVIEEQIRPAVAGDGGDVTFMGFEDGIVKLRLTGACAGCPSATATLQFGIQSLLTEEVPEVQGIEQVL